MKLKTGDRVKRILSIWLVACAAWSAEPEYVRAHKLYQLTEFQQSIQKLIQSR